MYKKQIQNRIKIINISSEKPEEEAAKHISGEINKELNNNIPVLFLVSGGSSLNVVNKLSLDKELIKQGDLTVTVVDERYTKISKNNNYEQFLDTKFYKVHNKIINVINTRVENNETHEQHAQRFEENLRKWKRDNPSGNVIGLFGIGGDYHTSGIMPNNVESLYKSEKWVVNYNIGDYENEHKKRTTTTIYFIKHVVDSYYIYAVGDGKREALKSILNDPVDFKSRPASVFKDIAQNSDKRIKLFTDQEI